MADLPTICPTCGNEIAAWSNNVCPRCRLLDQETARYGKLRPRNGSPVSNLSECLHGTWYNYGAQKSQISFNFDDASYVHTTAQGTHTYHFVIINDAQHEVQFQIGRHQVQASITTGGSLELSVSGQAPKVYRRSDHKRLCPICHLWNEPRFRQCRNCRHDFHA